MSGFARTARRPYRPAPEGGYGLSTPLARGRGTGSVPCLNELLITPTGLTRLAAELERLKTAERRASAERLRDAAETGGNRAANTDYLIAREERERVRLRSLETGRRVEYELVGALERDLEAGKISAASPLGAAILGRRQGEIAVVGTPRGEARYEIVAIGPAV